MITNKLYLPDAYVDLFADDEYDNGGADFSVTGLLAPPRLLRLVTRHAEDITEDVVDRIPSRIGTLLHRSAYEAALRRNDPRIIAERRLFIERTYGERTWKISGAMDSVMVENGLLDDYKFPGVGSLQNKMNPKYGYTDWTQQLNLYAHILEENGVTITGMRVVATPMGWQASGAARSDKYPAPVVSLPIELWSPTYREAFLMARLAVHVDSMMVPDDDLPLCTPEERWIAPLVYAVMKPGRKSAVSLHDLKAEAELAVAANPGWTIETRGGYSKRCPMYCAAGKSGKCAQWEAEKVALGTPVEDVDMAALG